MASTGQLDLFASEPAESLDTAADAALMERVPRHVRFGTSSWTFPGWAGIVYPGRPATADLVERGLEMYAAHPLFRTVGIDRSYYRPLDQTTLSRYADQLPPGFACVSKVWMEVTSPVRPRSRAQNPKFLDVRHFTEHVLRPLERAFMDHVGPLVLEFPPSTGQRLGPDDFARRLDVFLQAAPRGFSYAVELRNRELLTPRYLDVLARHGAAHVLSFWEAMPSIGVQMDHPGILPAPFVVCRLLIPPGRRYEERKRSLSPFDAVVDPQHGMRADVVRLIRICEELGKVVFVIVNNKAEGSSPLTIRALTELAAKPAEAS